MNTWTTKCANLTISSSRIWSLSCQRANSSRSLTKLKTFNVSIYQLTLFKKAKSKTKIKITASHHQATQRLLSINCKCLQVKTRKKKWEKRRKMVRALAAIQNSCSMMLSIVSGNSSSSEKLKSRRLLVGWLILFQQEDRRSSQNGRWSRCNGFTKSRTLTCVNLELTKKILNILEKTKSSQASIMTKFSQMRSLQNAWSIQSKNTMRSNWQTTLHTSQERPTVH